MGARVRRSWLLSISCLTGSSILFLVMSPDAKTYGQACSAEKFFWQRRFKIWPFLPLPGPRRGSDWRSSLAGYGSCDGLGAFGTALAISYEIGRGYSPSLEPAVDSQVMAEVKHCLGIGERLLPALSELILSMPAFTSASPSVLLIFTGTGSTL
jgi:hypothetical protein